MQYEGKANATNRTEGPSLKITKELDRKLLCDNKEQQCMKKFLFLLFVLSATAGYSQQQILLFTDTIENPDPSFDFTTGGVGTMSGSNQWVINKSYTGGGAYPNTTPEDSVVSGSIANAPYSFYLHIYDSVAAANGVTSDCNWNPSVASDRFCFINSGLCTLGLTDVTFTFFWIAGGDSSAYGQLYYRSNGGPWIQTGRPKYQGQKDWLYEVVTDTGFNNKQNLQFGFRWVDSSEVAGPGMSFGVDDIIAVGTYDNVNHPVTMTVTVTPDTICVYDYLQVNVKLSQPLCDGTYEVIILNSTNHVVNTGSNPLIYIYAPDTTGVAFFQPDSALAGNCYHIVVQRINPAPAITSDTSACFSIVRCPASISTYTAPVMTDNDTACILSELDVYFFSFGSFNSNNIYTAQLSDSNGSFANPFRLGTLPTSQTFNSFPPGDISGMIPANVPPGCNYYIRVISSAPRDTGSIIGPFCLKKCDIQTNNITDLDYCIGFPYPTDTNTFVIKINQWNNQTTYDTCNNFTVQLLDMMSFAVVNTGGIGIFHVNRTDTFKLIVGPNIPVAPGTYYLRVLSDCSTSPSDTSGTVIRITIGNPNPVPPVITSTDSIFCNDQNVAMTINPYNFSSTYEWLSPSLNNGLPFTWPGNQLNVNFTLAPVGTYVFRVREINNGCPGPWSAAKNIYIISVPRSHISGPAITCLGDTATFYVDYLPRTYYTWTVPPGVNIVLQGNSQVSMVFDSVGTYTISEYSLNACGSDSGTFTFTVATLLSVQIAPKQNICSGDSLRLNTTTPGLNRSLLTIDSSIAGKPGAMFNLIAHGDLTIDSFACKILAGAGIQATIQIFQKTGTYQSYEFSNTLWNNIMISNPITTGANQMTTLPDYIGMNMAAGDTFGIYITDIDSPSITIAYSPAGPPGAEGAVYRTDGILDYVQGVVNNLAPHYQPFGAYLAVRVWDGIVYYHTKAGLHYIWNTGDTASSINAFPPSDSLYTVKLFDSTGCFANDSVFIKVNTRPTLSVGPDTAICIGLSYTVPGLSSVPSIVWLPDSGLSNANIAAPTWHYSDSMSYTVIAYDTANGCTDTVRLNIGAENCTSYIDGPQAFSPNGDGNNDFYSLFSNKIASYEIRIYNRWGELVYKSSDLSILNDTTLSKGWDGTYQGKPQIADTYVYYITATDDFNKQISKKGNITLLR
jgi:gliding motility-associated-like protein